MNKIFIGLILAIIIILVGAGYYFIPNSEANMPEISNNTGLLDYTDEPVTNWNENTHEYKFHQKIVSDNNQELENVSIDIIFYKNGKQIGIESKDIDNIENNAFNLDFTIKLDSEPDEFYYNVTDLN